MFTRELKHGNVKKIVADPTSGDVYVIHPIFPLAKVSKHYYQNKDWGVTGVVSKVLENLHRAIGRADLTLMKKTDGKWDHPMKEGKDQFENYSYQAGFSIGKLMHVFENPDSDNVIWGASRVTDPIAKPVVLEYMDSYNKSLVPLFVSPQIVNSSDENPYAIEKFDLMHVALVSDPAFEESVMKVGAVCQGNVQQCTMQIRTASNTTENANVVLIGKDVTVHHKTCPFCVKDELTRLFSENSSLKLNKASNLQMSAQQEEKPQEEKIINPDTDQNKDSSAMDPVKLAELVDAKIKDAFAKQDVKAQEEPKPEEPKPEEPKQEKKETESKEISFKDSPEYKAMASKMEKLSKQLDDNKVDKEELKTLKAEQNFNKIGTLLAKYESNFINPQNGKPEPKAFDKAFEFLRNTDWSLEDIETTLQILTPFGNMTKKYETQQAPESVIQKAARNRGVPEYNAAFGDKVNSASKGKSDSGLSLLDCILQENQA